MAKIDPGATGRVEPLVVRPRVAWQMLDCGNTRGYQLIAAGELETFLDGSARKITVESIRNLIARRLEAAKNDAEQLTPQARRRERRSRPAL